MFSFAKSFGKLDTMVDQARRATAGWDKKVADAEAKSLPFDAAHQEIQRQSAAAAAKLAAIEAGAIDGVTAQSLAELRAEVDLLRLRTGPAGEAYLRSRAAVNEVQAARSQDLRNRRAEMKSKLQQIAAAAEEEIERATGIMRAGE